MRKIILHLLLLTVLVILGEIAYTSVTKVNYTGGATGRTQKTPATQGCTCHGSQTNSLPVSITGSSAISADSSSTYSFSIGGASPNIQGGFNLSLSDDAQGFLMPVSSGVTYDGSTKELYHNPPKAYSSGSVSWSFKLIPTAVSNTTVTLYGVGLNGNGSGTGGDVWNYASKTVTITPNFPAGTSFSPANNSWDTKDNFPLNQSNAYDRFASIYTSADVAFGKITRLGYFVGTEGTINWPLKIYMKEVAASTFSAGTTVNTEISGATLVYDGTPSATPVAGWMMINLTTAFDYSSNNLEIIVFNEKGSASTDNKQTLSKFVTNGSQYWSNTNNGNTNGTVYSLRPNLRVERLTAPSLLTAGSSTPTSVSLSWAAASAGSGYRIVFKPAGTSISSPTDGGYADISGASNTTFTVTGLPANRSYIFKVYTRSGNFFSTSGTNEITTSTGAYTSGSFASEQSAALIFGQSALESNGTANEGGLSASSLSSPASLYADSTGTTTPDGRFYAADMANNRVLIYPPFSSPSDKPAATGVLGQTLFTTATSGTSATTLSGPNAVWVYNSSKIIVSDSANHRILIWNTTNPANGQAADIVLGQATFNAGNANRGGAVAANTLSSPESVITFGNKLIVADGGNNRVLIWNNINNLSNGQNADVVIGQSNFTSAVSPGVNASTASSLHSPKAIGVTTDGKLLIASRLEHRVLIYHTIPATNGAAADRVLGQISFTSNQFGGTTDSTFGFPAGIAVSPISNKVAVSEWGTERVLIWNSFPVSNNEKPSIVLGRTGLASAAVSSFSNQSGYHASTVIAPKKIFWSKGGKLYVPMARRNGIVRFDNGDVLASGPTNLSGTPGNNNIVLNWTGGTASQFRIVYKPGNIAPSDTADGVVVDQITGNSTQISGLECNTPYSFRIWGKQGTEIMALPTTAVTTAQNTTAGASCNNIPESNGVIYDIAVSGNTAYVAGYFTEFGGLARNGLAAFNITTNAILGWNPNLTSDGVNAAGASSIKVSADGNHVFVGGNFNFVGSNGDTGLAKISTTTGISVLSYPNVNPFADINHITVANDNTIYFYGSNLYQVGNNFISGCASIDGSGNVRTTFNPNMNGGNISALQINESNTRLYIGQYNTSVNYNGTFRRTITELDAATGALTSFNPIPTPGNGVSSIVLNGNSMYISGSFNQVDDLPTIGANTPRRGIAKLINIGGNWTLDTIFAPSSYSNSPSREFNYGTTRHELMGMWLNGNKLYMAGAVTNYNGTPRYGFVALDTTNASLIQSFNPGVSYVGFSSSFRMTGTATHQKIFTVARSASSGTHINGKPFVSGMCQIPLTSNIASVNKMANGNNTMDFTSATGVDIQLTGNTSGSDSGLVTVDYYGTPAYNTSSIPMINIGTQRWIIHAPQNSAGNSFPAYTSAQIRFDLDEIPGRAGITSGNEPYIKVYRRAMPNGSGFYPTFVDCGPVIYDTTTHEIKVNVSSFGEFVFASNLIGPSVLSANAANNQIQLNWSGGNVSQYRIVYKTGNTPPADLNDGTVIDNLTGNTFTVGHLDCNSMYSFRIWGKQGSNYTSIPATPVTQTQSTTAGAGCLNFPATDGTINDMVTFGTTLYVTGNFTQIGGVTRKGIAALNGTNNTVLSWNPSLTTDGTTAGYGNTIKVSADGNHVFVGGAFNFVGTNPDINLAKINTTTGISIAAYPNVTGGAVQNMTIAPDNSIYFYADGATTLGAMTITGCGAVNGNETVKTGFNPNITAGEVNRLRAIHINETNTRLYIGHGNGTATYNGVSRSAMVELDAATGSLTSFTPNPSNGAGVFGIITKGNSMWICGSFSQIDNLPTTAANTPRRGLAKFNWNGTDWTLDAAFAPSNHLNAPNGSQGFGQANHGIRNIWLNGNKLYATGVITNFAGIPRYAFLAMDTGNASLITTFNTGVSYVGVSGTQKTTGSSALQRLFTTTAANYSGQHVAGRPYTTSMCIVDLNQQIVSVNRMVNANSVFDFTSATAVDISITGNALNGDSGLVTAEFHPSPAYDLSSLPETNLSNFRWIIHAPQNAVGSATNPGYTNAEIRFDLDEIPGRGGISIGQESNVKIYRRNLPSGSTLSPFIDCGTVTYDPVTHELKINTTDLGEFVFASNSASLPVEWLSFNGFAKQPDEVQLMWSVTSETNNHGFTIERSSDGHHFEDIGFVGSVNAGTEITRYLYTDTEINVLNKTIFYRLKQTDRNGLHQYSNIIAVNYTKNKITTLFPNPAKSTLSIQTNSRLLRTEITDMIGRTLHASSNGDHMLNISFLPSGFYYLQLQYEDGEYETLKFIKE